jgi:hypothetical protein
MRFSRSSHHSRCATSPHRLAPSGRRRGSAPSVSTATTDRPARARVAIISVLTDPSSGVSTTTSAEWGISDGSMPRTGAPPTPSTARVSSSQSRAVLS